MEERPFHRGLARLGGVLALLVALALQAAVWLVTLLETSNLGYGGHDEWRWLADVALLDLIIVVPLGYAACLKGSRDGLRLAGGCAAALLAQASAIAAWSAANSSAAQGLTLLNVGWAAIALAVVSAPGWLLLVGIAIMRRSGAPRRAGARAAS